MYMYMYTHTHTHHILTIYQMLLGINEKEMDYPIIEYLFVSQAEISQKREGTLYSYFPPMKVTLLA